MNKKMGVGRAETKRYEDPANILISNIPSSGKVSSNGQISDDFLKPLEDSSWS